MKSNLTKIITFIILISFTLNSHGQQDFIITGHTENVYFTDIEDTTLFSSYFGEHIYDIDIDADSIMDFVITAYYQSGTSHDYQHVSITPYGNNKVALHDSVKAHYNYSYVHFFNRCQGSNYGDTIDNSMLFIKDKVYLVNHSHQTMGYAVNLNWKDWNYIPVCLTPDSLENCKYGWIKVSDLDARGITVESYAVYSETSSIDQLKVQNEIHLYPNPSNDFIYIKNKNPLDFFTQKIDIIDIYGQKHHPLFEVINNECKINIKHLPNGYYTLILYTNTGITSTKFIKSSF